MEIRADLTKSVRTFRKLDKAIRGAWRMIQYSGFEASSIQHNRNFTIFRFVTAPIDRIYYVSGTLHVGGERYLKVFENMKAQGYT